MYFVALATDYDGTIAEDGVVAEATLEALRELKQSGRKLLLVTGRQLPELKKVLPEIALFDLIVAENAPSFSIQRPARKRSSRQNPRKRFLIGCKRARCRY
jgi:HAD superfamily hydrolase (TIGR01484 family)